MITLIITAALLALFTATFIYFLSACLQFFDFVIKGIKGIFKAIKVLILKKNGKVHYATMYQQDGKIKLVEPTNESEERPSALICLKRKKKLFVITNNNKKYHYGNLKRNNASNYIN